MLVVFNTSNGMSSGENSADGLLTDGTTKIRIRQVMQWEDGKTTVLNTICGYEFYLGDDPLSAVQSSVDTFQKRYVWLNQNLEEPIKSKLAAAAAALMVHTDSMISGMD